MAKVTLSEAVNLNNLDFYEVIAGSYNRKLYDNLNTSYYGIRYEDVFEIDWRIVGDTTQYYASLFCGRGMLVNESGVLTEGRLTGYLTLRWTGSSWSHVWRIEDISYDARTFFASFLSQGISDDDAVIKNVMSGYDSIEGSGGDDYLLGYEGNDVLRGNEGNDTLEGGGAPDMLFGGLGTDTAVYRDFSKNFSLKAANDYISVRGPSVTQSNDTLYSIEKIQFSDLSVQTSWFWSQFGLSSSEQNSLTALYIASFNRAPDAIGLSYWADRFYFGMPLTDIAKSFFVQPETLATYPSGMPTRTFISNVYNNVLSRAPDTDGLNYWTREIDSGHVSKDVFLLAIINGANAVTGGASDRQTLVNKITVGNYFAIDKGLNNLDWAIDVMRSVTSLTSGVAEANVRTNAYYSAIADIVPSNTLSLGLLGIDTIEII